MKNLLIGFVSIACLGLLALKTPAKHKHIHPKKTQEIKWLDFESGYIKAKKENKILLIDVYTDWCGWCKVMDRETYTNDTVIQAINKDFVTVKLNPEKYRYYVMEGDSFSSTELHAWLGYGKKFGFPTTYFMVKPGKTEERYASIGFSKPYEFMDILNQMVTKKNAKKEAIFK